MSSGRAGPGAAVTPGTPGAACRPTVSTGKGALVGEVAEFLGGVPEELVTFRAVYRELRVVVAEIGGQQRGRRGRDLGRRGRVVDVARDDVAELDRLLDLDE